MAFTGDLDQRNGPDLVARSTIIPEGGSPGLFAIYLNDGAGQFDGSAIGDALVSFPSIDGWLPTDAGDVNNDGFPDFIVVVDGTNPRIYY